MNPARHIILSNVRSSIPHAVIKNQIKSLGSTTVSAMSFLRTEIRNTEYTQVLCFRSSPTSIVAKVIESIIYDQMCKFLLDHQVIQPEQHGFCPENRSSQTSFVAYLTGQGA